MAEGAPEEVAGDIVVAEAMVEEIRKDNYSARMENILRRIIWVKL
jgi:hypothetical protein